MSKSTGAEIVLNRVVADKSRSRRQSGATAVEFALIVPLLVGMLYGIVTYGYVFVLRQILSMGAEEAARAAAAITTGGTGALALQQAAATSTGVAAFSILPAAQQQMITGPTVTSFVSQGTSIKVKVTMTLTGLFPVFKLPLIGPVPNLPASMEFDAVE